MPNKGRGRGRARGRARGERETARRPGERPDSSLDLPPPLSRDVEQPSGRGRQQDAPVEEMAALEVGNEGQGHGGARPKVRQQPGVGGVPAGRGWTNVPRQESGKPVGRGRTNVPREEPGKPVGRGRTNVPREEPGRPVGGAWAQRSGTIVLSGGRGQEAIARGQQGARYETGDADGQVEVVEAQRQMSETKRPGGQSGGSQGQAGASKRQGGGAKVQGGGSQGQGGGSQGQGGGSQGQGGGAQVQGGGSQGQGGGAQGQNGGSQGQGGGAGQEDGTYGGQPEQDRGDGQERQRRTNHMDLVLRPEGMAVVPGVEGAPIRLRTNYFSLNFPDNLVLYQYHVDFNPPCDSKKVRLALLYVHENLIGRVHAFDGAMLFLIRRLPERVTEVYSTRQWDSTKVRLTIRLTQELPPRNPTAIQVFNVIFKRMLRMLGMTQVQRHYFDFGSSIEVQQHKIQIIPGVETAIGPYDRQVLLNVDIAHKLLRMDTVLDVMYEEYQRRENFDDVLRRIIGTTVMTRYNNKTYRVEDIDNSMRVTNMFRLSNGTEISYEDYFFQHYQERVTDPEQPLLVSRPSAREQRQGGNRGPIYLVPEFCILTGLTDEMRSNFNLMRDLAVHTRIAPSGRMERLQTFRDRFEQNEEVRTELENWGFQFSRNPIQVPGRIHTAEKLSLGGNQQITYSPQSAEWSQEMRGKKLLVTPDIKNWLLIYPQRCQEPAKIFIQCVQRVAPPMGMRVESPRLVGLPNDRNETYIRALSDNVTRETQMVVCILPNNRKDRYDAIKKFCLLERPVSSQMIVQRSLTKTNPMSVCTKIAIQLNCKLGGEAWALPIPFGTPTMVIGIDTYHDSAYRNRSVGAVVCSLNRHCTRYYSRVTFQASHVEMINSLTTIFIAALRKFHEVNNRFPQQIIIYRDGVGDGQLEAVFSHEMPQVLNGFRTFQQDFTPKVTFVVVKKRINTRLFTQQQGGAAGNPPPGTVVDTDITNRNWYDFFLISQSVRQGTVSPTHYNVIWDDTGKSPDWQQKLAYKMTHLYYNWQGTIRVPAPCQYAHKLAFLVGQSIHQEPSLHMSDKLFYL